MRMMPGTFSKAKSKQTACLRGKQTRSKSRRKKRKLSCSSLEDILSSNSRKRRKGDSYTNRYVHKSFHSNFLKNSDLEPNDRLVIEEKFVWKSSAASFQKNPENKRSCGLESSVSAETFLKLESKCWINDLPQEILLKIFSFLPLGMLLHTVPQICKKWEVLAMDWTLWKSVEDLTIKDMVISTKKLSILLRTIPRLKKLELILRNDTEELLSELVNNHQNLEVLKLDRCYYHSTLQKSKLSQTVTSILDFCPKLKTLVLTDTHFHNKNFYKSLARAFRSIERINVTCTTQSEMDIFIKNLKENIPEVEFQKIPMMGKAAGKQIYWGSKLGLVVRPIPTSPFHQQYIHNDYPSYAF